MVEPSSSASASSQRGGRPELQGPRPTPLKVRKESHKIRKPPPPPQQQQPVIIYMVSPKVVHANPAEFMSVVQRLTGPPRTFTPPQQPPTLSLFAPPPPEVQPSFPFNLQSAAWPSLDQAAAARSADDGEHGVGVLPPLPMSTLSPVPGSLPAIPSAGLFSPAASELGELMMSPAAAPFVVGASSAAATSSSPTPAAGADAYYYWDLLNNINMQMQQYHH